MKRIIVLLMALPLVGCGGMFGGRMARDSFYLPCTEVDVTHDGVVGIPDYNVLAKQGASYRQMASLEHWFGQTCH